MTPSPLLIRKPILKQIPDRRPRPAARRQTIDIIDIKIPGAHLDLRPSLEHERKLEEHVRKIEGECVVRDKSNVTPDPVEIPSGEFDERCMPNPVDSPSRHREQRPRVHGPREMPRPKNMSGDSTQLEATPQIEYVKIEPLRRLSLGEISWGLNMFD